MSNALNNTHMMIDDLPSLVGSLAERTDVSSAASRNIAEAGSRLSEELGASVRLAFPDTRLITTPEIDAALASELQSLLDRYPGAAILTFDKQLPRLSTDAPLFHLRMTRTAEGSRLPRQGSSQSIDGQLQGIEAALGDRKVIVVDDCWSTGGTMRFFLDQPTQGMAWRERVAAIVTAEGPDVSTFEGIPLHIAFRFRNLVDGVMASDLTPFGGRTHHVSSDGASAVSSPYVPPFADGRFWGLDAVGSEQYFTASKKILEAQDAFFSRVNEALGRDLSFDEWNRLGFPSMLSPDADHPLPRGADTLEGVIRRAKEDLMIHAGHAGNISNLITDFDNTVYAYAGSSRYTGSVLAQRHDEKVAALVRSRLAGDKADRLIATALVHPNTSVVLARALNMTREQCLDLVWKEIDPEECCLEHPGNIALLERVRSSLPGKLTMLTGAPLIWIKNVARHLRLPLSLFDRIITTEQYGHKKEVFERLAKEDTGLTVATGDDPATDVHPARKQGMYGIIVKNSVRSLHYAGRLFPS